MVDIAYYKRINSEFYRRVGVINCVLRLNKLGLEPQCIIGTFYLSDIEKLFEICNENPSFHIITHIGSGLTVNHFVQGKYRFRLAEGDSDPSIELRLPPEVCNHFLAELNHFIRRANIGF